MDKKELFRHVGDISQLYGVRRVTYADGPARGMAAIEAEAASGLRFTVLEGRGLDVYEMSYKGLNLCFRTKNGLVSGEKFSTVPGEFARTMNGGMFFTAGLSNVGGDVTEDGVYYPVHGRQDGAAASEVYALTNDEDLSIEIGGKMRESQLFGENLHLTRRLWAPADTPELVLDDTLENLATRPADIAILYHCNLGYPFLDEGVRFFKSGGTVTPRNDDAAAGLATYNVITAPQDNVPEQVFLHKNLPAADGMATAMAVNEKLALAFYVRYAVDTLPNFAEWKSMAAGDYVLGMEPTNNLLRGRVEERAAGGLATLEPFESMRFHVELGVLDGMNKIETFRKAYCM